MHDRRVIKSVLLPAAAEPASPCPMATARRQDRADHRIDIRHRPGDRRALRLARRASGHSRARGGRGRAASRRGCRSDGRQAIAIAGDLVEVEALPGARARARSMEWRRHRHPGQQRRQRRARIPRGRSGRVAGTRSCTSTCARRSCCCRKPSRSMKTRGGGSIVNIGSVNAYIGEPKLGPYSVSKGGLMTLTRNAAATLNRYRIRVNQINVGWTLTEGSASQASWKAMATSGSTRPSRRGRSGGCWLPRDVAHCGRLLRVGRQRARDGHGHGSRTVSRRRTAELLGRWTRNSG